MYLYTITKRSSCDHQHSYVGCKDEPTSSLFEADPVFMYLPDVKVLLIRWETCVCVQRRQAEMDQSGFTSQISMCTHVLHTFTVQLRKNIHTGTYMHIYDENS